MKNIITILAIITIVINVNAQTNWTKKAGYMGISNAKLAHFSINNLGYAGLGTYDSFTKFSQEFWEYNPIINVWLRKNDVPFGYLSNDFSGFVINNKGYVLGSCFLQYDNNKDNWIIKYPTASGLVPIFVVDKKAYSIRTKYSNSSYNPDSNTWTAIAPFPGFSRDYGVAFAIGNKGYYGMGSSGSGYWNDMWQYSPDSNTWKQMANYNGYIAGGSLSPKVFVIGNDAYLMGIEQMERYKEANLTHNFFAKYNAVTNTWQLISDTLPAPVGNFDHTGFAFSINGKGYVYTGTSTDNFWEYDPKEVRLQSITTTKLNCFVDSITLQYQIVPYKNHVITAQLAPEGTVFANPIILTTFTDSTGIANKKIALPTGLNNKLVYEIRLISNFGDTSSTEKLVLNLFPRNLIISKVSNTQLTCNGSASNSYTWLLNGQWVGVTNPAKPNLTITQNGYYQVVFDSQGCKTTSDSFNVNFVGLAETQKQLLSSIYPNPNNGEFTLIFNQNNEPKTIEILDALGKLQATFITNNQTYQAQLNHLAKGIYFVKINTPNAQQMVKLLIE